jgi:hypothetical protein
MNPTKYLSCDKQVSRLEKILHSLATRVARIVLQRVEETFPAVRERMVSVCGCVHRTILLSVNSDSLKNLNIFCQSCGSFHNPSEEFTGFFIL